MLWLSINLREDVVKFALNSVKFAINLFEWDFFSAHEETLDSFPCSRLPYLRFVCHVRPFT